MMTEQGYFEQFSGEDAPSAFDELADILARFVSTRPPGAIIAFSTPAKAYPIDDYLGGMGVMQPCPDCDGVGLDKADENPCARCGGDGFLYPV